MTLWLSRRTAQFVTSLAQNSANIGGSIYGKFLQRNIEEMRIANGTVVVVVELFEFLAVRIMLREKWRY